MLALKLLPRFSILLKISHLTQAALTDFKPSTHSFSFTYQMCGIDFLITLHTLTNTAAVAVPPGINGGSIGHCNYDGTEDAFPPYQQL